MEESSEEEDSSSEEESGSDEDSSSEEESSEAMDVDKVHPAAAKADDSDEVS